MPSIAFICVANSARSQLAEAIARHFAPGLDVWSAGSRPTHVRPEVRTVLEELDIPADGMRSKTLDEIPLDEANLIVTLCCEESCPILPTGALRRSWPLPDPASAPRSEALEAFRATRDELLRRIPTLLRELGAQRGRP